METTVEMAVGDFRECPGHRGITRLGWTRQTAKTCRLKGDDDYQQSALDSLREQNWGRTLQGGNALLHPPNFNPPDIRCQNGYLLWLNVVLNLTDSEGVNRLSQRCAYEFGAEDPSIMGTWHDVRSMQAELGGMIGSTESLPCWRLESDDCVVAFHDPANLTHQEAMEALFSKAMAVICGSLSAVAATVAVYLGCFARRPHSYSPLPRSSREEEILDERVGAILRSAAAHWNESTPLGSPRTATSDDASPEGGDAVRFAALSSSEEVEAKLKGTTPMDPMSNIAAKLLAEAESV